MSLWGVAGRPSSRYRPPSAPKGVFRGSKEVIRGCFGGRPGPRKGNQDVVLGPRSP